jgi:predicted DNA-binding antitoxin AbrB/MazE fold protein
MMSITVEAVYENGVLRPVGALPFGERQRVQIIVKAVPSRVRQTAGLMGWTGSQEDADFVAASPELDSQEDE